MERVFWIVLIASMVWAVAMAFEASAFDKSLASGPLSRFESPVAMLELADSQQRFSAILDQAKREKNLSTMRVNTYMDFVFIILYCLTFIFLALVCSRASGVAMAVGVTIVTAGVFDCWENLRLLGQFRLMTSTTLTKVPLPRPVSLAKWAMFALALCLVGVVLLEARRRVSNPELLVMVVFVFLAAGCTTVGLFRNRLISASVLCLFPALLIAAWIWRPWR